MTLKYTMTLKYAIFVTMTIVCSECYSKQDRFHKDSAFADQMCPLEQVDFQTITQSAVSCVRKCSENNRCKSLIYFNGNKTCFVIKSDNPFTVPLSLPGAVFYKSNSSATMVTTPSSSTTITTVSTTNTATTTPPPSTETATITTATLPPPPPPPPLTTTTLTTDTPTTSTTTTTSEMTTPTSSQQTTTISPGTPLVAGASESQFSASSYYSEEYRPWYARLDNTVSSWVANISDQNQYIQIDFGNQTLATHVLTQGHPTYVNWVTSYKVWTSNDCTTFDVFTDEQNNDVVFMGNSDSNTAVQHALNPPVMCRCFRINPWSWHNTYIDLRFEVLAHVL